MADLSKYIEDTYLRERIIKRVKGVTGFDCVGGRKHDQCYFSGAVKLLQNLEEVDLALLHSGKIAMEDVPRVKRISKTASLPLPSFAADMSEYVSILREMRSVNELSVEC